MSIEALLHFGELSFELGYPLRTGLCLWSYTCWHVQHHTALAHLGTDNAERVEHVLSQLKHR